LYFRRVDIMITLLTKVGKCSKCECFNVDECGLSETLLVSPNKEHESCPLKTGYASVQCLEGKEIVERVFIAHDNLTDHLSVSEGAQFVVLGEGDVRFVKSVTGLTMKVCRTKGRIEVSDITPRKNKEVRVYTKSFILDIHGVLANRPSLTF